MSMIKVPLLLLNAYLSDKAYTQPTAPAHLSELVKDEERARARLSLLFNKLINSIYTSFCIAECAVILASHYPSYQISKTVLSALVFTGSDQTLSRLQPTNGFIAGTILAFTGAIIRIICFRELGRFFTFLVSIRKDHKLITTGLYRYVRHPSYTGSLIHVIGAPMCHLSAGSWLMECGAFKSPVVVLLGLFWLSFAVTRCIYLVMRMKEEDEALRKEFGQQWDVWAAKVPYRVIPGFF